MSSHKPKTAEKNNSNAGNEGAREESGEKMNYEKIGVGTLDKESVYCNYDYKNSEKNTGGYFSRGKSFYWIVALVGSGVALVGVVLICLILGAIGVGRQSGGIRCTVEEAPSGEFMPDGNATNSGPLLLTKEVHIDPPTTHPPRYS